MKPNAFVLPEHRTLFARRRRMADGRPAFYAGQLRKVPSPREGGLQKQQGESPGKGAETTQSRDNVMIPLWMKSPGDLVKRRLPTGASSNGRIDFSSSAGRAHSRMPSASQEGNRKGLMSFTWLYIRRHKRETYVPPVYVPPLFLWF